MRQVFGAKRCVIASKSTEKHAALGAAGRRGNSTAFKRTTGAIAIVLAG
jgi:hypothetical protein